MASPHPVRAVQRNLHHQLLRSGLLITGSSRAPECFCEIVPSRAKNDARGCNGGLRQKLAALLQRACRRSDQIKSATEKILRPRSPAAVTLLCTTGVVHRSQRGSIRTPRRQTLRRDHASALGRTSPADIPPLRFSPGAAPAPSRRKNLLRPPSF